MGIKDLQEFLESQCSSACLSVDLLKISKSFVPKRRGSRFNGRFCLIVDAESCLDRLYGGFYSDWVCGGQWNRMLQFLSNLLQACHSSNMDLVVFFNGTLESEKIDEWYATQVEKKKKVTMALRHIYNKGTPPPKVWWNPPVFLAGTLRMALRHLGIGIACSMDDHVQEVIGFCREHGLQGILGHESVYAIFDPPRYFSSQHLKLTYRGSLETKEYVMDEVAKCLDLNPNRFCLFAALLGNHILTEDDLYEFFKERLAKSSQEAGKQLKTSPENVVRAVVDYVRSLPDISNLDTISEPIFKNSKGNKAELVSKLKQSVQYYRNGTQDGFLSYRPTQGQAFAPPSQRQLQQRPQDASGYASQDQGVPPLMSVQVQAPHMKRVGAGRTKQGGAKTKLKGQEVEMPPVSTEVLRIASERHQKAQMSPWIYQVLSQGEIKMVVTLEDEMSRELPTSIDLYRPIRQVVYSVLLNLNKLKIVHDTQNKDKVNSSGAAPKTFEVPIKEWVVRRTGNQKPSFDLVMAKPVDWKAPSIERMWLGTQPEDKTRRLRAFLTCMRSDAPLMLNTNYVPQHLLVFCCVVRYMLQFGRILQSQELDAFLAMSVSPLLLDVQTMQDLKLPSIQPRGVALGALFMAGLETALFANDVCGAPIPWNVGCPWQFYDGKLFHFKLLKANNSTPLIDMCDGQVDQVMRVERMRQAIMEGVNVEFAKPMLSQSMYSGYPMGPYPGGDIFPFRPAGMRPMMHPGGPPMGFMGGMGPDGPPKGLGRGRGILGLPKKQGRSPVDGRGGQLEIAGVVVGSWGPNLSASGRGGRGNSPMSPRVTSVGMGRRGGAARGMMYAGMGRPMGGRIGPMPMYGMPPEAMFYARRGRGVVHGIRRPGVRARPNPTAKPKNKNKTTPAKGRGMTVDASGGREVVVSVKYGVDEDDDDDDDSKAIFEDADDGSGAIGGKVILQNGIQGPDSAESAEVNG